MKKPLCILTLSVLFLRVEAGDFSSTSKFSSVANFVGSALSYEPATTKSDLASLFTVFEPGQPEDPKTGTRTSAKSIQSSDALWTNDTHAIVFVSAMPPTEATRSAVGVLFLLVKHDNQWIIGDHLRFTATGKEAEISAELTAGTGTGYQLGSEGMRPVITVKQSQGGRGYDYQAYASYTFNDAKFKLLELNDRAMNTNSKHDH